VLEGHGEAVVCVASLWDGRVVSGSQDRTLRLWDVQHSTPTVVALEGQSDDIVCVAQLEDGRVASGSQDGTLWLWG
jgi:WD40 repeat protein